MRRSTAAAIGTLTGAALIIGVRLSATPPAAADLAGSVPVPPAAKTPAAKSPGAKAPAAGGRAPGRPKSGLKDGVFRGAGARNPYGTVQVTVRVAGGRVAAAEVSYPTTGNSATINPDAVARLRQETLRAQSADVAAVSGATYTSESYVKSLQSALDAAKA